jgi:hypothetical protein
MFYALQSVVTKVLSVLKLEAVSFIIGTKNN